MDTLNARVLLKTLGNAPLDLDSEVFFLFKVMMIVNYV